MASGGGRGQDELDQQSMDYNRALFELSGQIRENKESLSSLHHHMQVMSRCVFSILDEMKNIRRSLQSSQTGRRPTSSSPKSDERRSINSEAYWNGEGSGPSPRSGSRSARSTYSSRSRQSPGASPRTRGDKSGQHVTHDDIIDVACSILGQHPQGMPIAKLGTLMHRETQNHKLPTLLKERYGGLKKFLTGQPEFFIIGNNHPFNPRVQLRPRPDITKGSKMPGSSMPAPRDFQKPSRGGMPMMQQPDANSRAPRGRQVAGRPPPAPSMGSVQSNPYGFSSGASANQGTWGQPSHQSLFLRHYTSPFRSSYSWQGGSSDGGSDAKQGRGRIFETFNPQGRSQVTPPGQSRQGASSGRGFINSISRMPTTVPQNSIGQWSAPDSMSRRRNPGPISPPSSAPARSMGAGQKAAAERPAFEAPGSESSKKDSSAESKSSRPRRRSQYEDFLAQSMRSSEGPRPSESLGLAIARVRVGDNAPPGGASPSTSVSVARVVVVNTAGDILYDRLVKQDRKVLDYCTPRSGIPKGGLDGATKDLAAVTSEVRELLNGRTVVVHKAAETIGLLNLEFPQGKIRDVAILASRPDETLEELIRSKLNREPVSVAIEENARAILSLFMEHWSEWEAGVDTPVFIPKLKT